MVIRGLNVIFVMALQKHFFLYFMSKGTSSPADYQTFPTLFELEPVAGKKVTVDFSAPELSSLGGLTLVREYEKSSSSIIERIESCIKDPRWEPMVIHSQTEMLRQRIYQIMAGFEDADDCDRLCGDGILKMCAGRSASDEMDLASQPTMTRLENRLSRKELFDIGEAFIDDFIASYNSEPDSIIIDADDTNADTYGAQQLTLFNAYYGEYCYMPLLLFVGRSGKLILPILIYSDCYCDRGRMEQMISELKNGLKADRMSCNKFTANQFRLYLHCAAYVILHSFQADMLAGTELECSTITTMREKLLLSAVSIDEKKTCIRIRFSQKAPMLPEMVSVLTRLRHLPPS